MTGGMAGWMSRWISGWLAGIGLVGCLGRENKGYIIAGTAKHCHQTGLMVLNGFKIHQTPNNKKRFTVS